MQVKRGGKSVSLYTFATAEEAALCVARSPEGQAAARSRFLRRGSKVWPFLLRSLSVPLGSCLSLLLLSWESRTSSECELNRGIRSFIMPLEDF